MTTAEPRTATPIGFLNLPYDIRRQIYCYVVPRRQIIDVKVPCNGQYFCKCGMIHSLDHRDHRDNVQKPTQGLLNILQLCKQVTEECLDIFYGENDFRVNLDPWRRCDRDLISNFSPANLGRIRSLIVIADAYGFCFGMRSVATLDAAWKLVFPRLKTLLIVVNPVVKSWKPVENWIMWLSWLLNMMAHSVPDGVDIRVDDDGSKHIIELVRIHFPGYRSETSSTGDDYVRRRDLVNPLKNRVDLKVQLTGQ